jgi:hypothetical protein
MGFAGLAKPARHPGTRDFGFLWSSIAIECEYLADGRTTRKDLGVMYGSGRKALD